MVKRILFIVLIASALFAEFKGFPTWETFKKLNIGNLIADTEDASIVESGTSAIITLTEDVTSGAYYLVNCTANRQLRIIIINVDVTGDIRLQIWDGDAYSSLMATENPMTDGYKEYLVTPTLSQIRIRYRIAGIASSVQHDNLTVQYY